MATYTIIATGATPGPGQINSGATVTVSAGDIFIVDPSADGDINFVASGGGPHAFEVVFNASNTNGIAVTVGGNLTPSVSIADNVDLSSMDLDAVTSTGLTVNVGNNARLGKLDGSGTGADTITIGNGFTATGDWNTTGGADVITVGNDATFVNLKTGTGGDAVTLGDGASFIEIDTGEGNDVIWLGDNASGDKIKAGGGDDTIRTGANQQITTVDGATGNDSYTTQTSGTSPQNMESTTIVCFMEGTRIRTEDGGRAIEALRIGDLVWTLDSGFQPLRWVGRFEVSAERLRADPAVHPVRVRAGALAPGIPRRDLFLSQQHRLLVRSRIADRIFETPEGLVASKKMTAAQGIDIARMDAPFTYLHLVFDRHAVIDAEGAETESMLIAPQSLMALSEDSRSALLSAIATGHLRISDQTPARPILQSRAKIDALVARVQCHGKSLQEPVLTSVSAA